MRWGLTIKEIRTTSLTVLDTYQTFPWILQFLGMHVLTPYLSLWLSQQRKCNVMDCKSFIVQCLMVFTGGGLHIIDCCVDSLEVTSSLLIFKRLLSTACQACVSAAKAKPGVGSGCALRKPKD